MPLIDGRERLIRRFGGFTGGWPWQWTPGQAGAWIAGGGWAHSTIRSYQGTVALFLAYACDPRYGWVAECEQQVGARPVQIIHEWNTAVQVAGYEGRPERRPLTRAELQAFFDRTQVLVSQPLVGQVQVDPGRLDRPVPGLGLHRLQRRATTSAPARR